MIHLTSITRRFRVMDSHICRETTARLRAEIALERQPEKRMVHLQDARIFKQTGEIHGL